MITIRLESAQDLAGYATISIAYLVDRVLRPHPTAGWDNPIAESVSPPYLKDYDSERGADPQSWSHRFRLDSWHFLAAYRDDQRVGGLTMVQGDPSIDMLEERDDLGVIWDLRVAPEFRRSGVGTALMAAAIRHARASGLKSLKVETQNVNPQACRFYRKHGFELRRTDPSAYPDLPHETQLLWYRDL